MVCRIPFSILYQRSEMVCYSFFAFNIKFKCHIHRARCMKRCKLVKVGHCSTGSVTGGLLGCVACV